MKDEITLTFKYDVDESMANAGLALVSIFLNEHKDYQIMVRTDEKFRQHYFLQNKKDGVQE